MTHTSAYTDGGKLLDITSAFDYIYNIIYKHISFHLVLSVLTVVAIHLKGGHQFISVQKYQLFSICFMWCCSGFSVGSITFFEFYMLCHAKWSKISHLRPDPYQLLRLIHFCSFSPPLCLIFSRKIKKSFIF